MLHNGQNNGALYLSVRDGAARLEIALQGDTTALRLCLERIAPPRRDVPIKLSLPTMGTARDAARVAGAVLEAVATGELTPTEGGHLMGLVDSYRRTLETTELEARLAALEHGK